MNLGFTKKNVFFSFFLLSHFSLFSQTYLDSSLTVEKRVNDLLSRMTLSGKIGQMTQAGRSFLKSSEDITTYGLGSLLSGGGSGPSVNKPGNWAEMYDEYQSFALETRLKIPLIYGIDAVHGHNNVKGAVIFPHNIGLGCTRNPELVKKIGEITAREVAATGIDWTFAPCIAVPRNERWGRTYEGFGETPELAEQFGYAYILGLQGNSLKATETIVACAKHFVGDGGTTRGKDQGNAQMDEETLRNIHLPGYIKAIEAGTATIMASFNSWNGEKLHGHKYLLTDVLKGELGFEGFIISDWAGVDQVHPDYKTAVKKSINAGIDMVMVPGDYVQFTEILSDLVNAGEVPTERINDAVSRILRVKFRAGLFEKPFSDPSLLPVVGSPGHRTVARQAVRESVVLLKKKDGVLPLPRNPKHIHVAGKNANDIGNQCGGWSISWQGSSGNITEGTTIFEAIKQSVMTTEVTYSANGGGAGDANIGIAVIGETPYAEGAGDTDDLSLSPEDIEVVKNLKKNGRKVIVIIIAGRPLLINPIIPFSDAILAAWLPGTEGRGVTDILFGDYQPSGSLSHSWPATMEQIPINIGDSVYQPLFPYGYGIQSFSDSLPAVKPEIYSLTVNETGHIIELTLDKQICDVDNIQADNFLLTVNNVLSTIDSVQVKSTDSTTLILEINKPVSENNLLSLSFDGSLTTCDGHVIETFENRTVINNMSFFPGIHNLPGIVEAEDFLKMNGIQTENCVDTGGGENIGWVDAGDWLEYHFVVEKSGLYLFEIRLAGYEDGSFTLFADKNKLGELTYQKTSGWQNWKTYSTEIYLPNGEYIFKLEANYHSVNINWLSFDFMEQSSFISAEWKKSSPDPLKTKIFPNPSKGIMNITSENRRKLHVNVFSVHGQHIYSGVVENKLMLELENGFYFIHLSDNRTTDVKNILIQR
jgi:beta-glucosidase